ncbi:dopamine beta-hydroxylase-like [Mizuhopecten yessoensis]|uniref:Dopamine beta-hydroxylase n=1 Tax=Mizuhopecten yessoensis TaxID=6573 RepID=A0A210QFM7_MIZYE|nr:dopamine beta-hydroxylase-like [Mizuhopecten yessoensis]OWF47545.1 Dopamine beta-hydroxylase [Mizuhopecten yessoensis]
MWDRIVRVLCLFLLCLCDVIFGFNIFQERIPNGDKVQDPCNRNDIWKGVGHQNKLGGGLTNPFGQAFKNNNFVWDKSFCMLDSDGDGATNGRELGDPLCIWKYGRSPIFEPNGHPGVCEPWSSPFCQKQNANWLKCPTVPVDCEFIRQQGVQNMALRLPDTAVPAQETTNMCVNLEFPSDRDYHVIADTAFLNNSKVLHHMTLQACSPGVTVTALAHPLGQVYPCEMLAEPLLCPDLMVGWTPTIGGNCHPLEAGYKIGLTGYRYAILQVMWNNPSKAVGERDSSGILLFYTPQLRRFNIGMLTVGTNNVAIPPGERGFDVEAQCYPTCTRKQLSNPIRLLTGYNHMHYAGAEMRVTLKKPGTVQEETLTRDIVYDYDNPVIHKFSSSIDIKPGDAIYTSCSYNTMTRNMSTFFGRTTSDEMCLGLFSYYPAEHLSPRHCFSEMGLPQCALTDSATIVDRCHVVTFPSSPEATAIIQSLKDNCIPFRCLRECINVVKKIRTNPCFKGTVNDYIIKQIQTLHGLETIMRLKSCDVEIAQEQGLCNKLVGQTNCYCSDPPMRRKV